MAKSGGKKRADEALLSEISEEFDTFENWFVENWKLIAGVAVLIVVAVAAYALINASVEKKDMEARKAFANALTVDEIQAIIAKYPTHQGTNNARARLVELYIADKNYDAAYAALRILSTSATADIFVRGKALLDSAYILEVQNKTDEAIREFETIANNPQISEDLRAEATYAAGRLYVSKNEFSKARTVLSRLNFSRQNSVPVATWSEKSMEILNRLPAETTAPKDSVDKPTAN